jgi:hypothetical protein
VRLELRPRFVDGVVREGALHPMTPTYVHRSIAIRDGRIGGFPFILVIEALRAPTLPGVAEPVSEHTGTSASPL